MTKAKSPVVRFPMSFRKASLVSLVGVMALAGCHATSTDDIRERFTDAGGKCAAWTSINDSRAVDSIECSDGAMIYLFTGADQRSDFVKAELESNESIRARTHIMLSGENWLIIDRIAVIVQVMPSLHGIIQGRNGANP